MPKEQIRQRGKRKRNQDGDAPPSGPPPASEAPQAADAQAGPSQIHPARMAMLNGKGPGRSHHPADHQRPALDAELDLTASDEPVKPEVDPEFPFGVLDPDLKAYFRNVEEQIKDWQGTSSVGEEREDRQNFLSSVLAELRNHELPLSTDPDCSLVLERLLPSMGDRGRRVLGDSFAGHWETLLRHRFGSHVVQSWIRLGAETLDREDKGIWPAQQPTSSVKPEVGELPTMQELFKGLVEAIRPKLPNLLTNSHASPPIRLLLLALTPSKSLPSSETGEKGSRSGGVVRSKKSEKYRKNQAVGGKGFLDADDEGQGKGKEPERVGEQGSSRQVAQPLVDLRKEVTLALRKSLSVMDLKAMGMDIVGSAAVQLLLELEVVDDQSTQSGSLLDTLTDGLVTKPELQTGGDYIPTLLTSQAGTHLLDAILLYAPLPIFNKIWSLHFLGKIGKMAGHPTSNYVVAKAVGRLDGEGIKMVVEEIKDVTGGKGLIRTGRSSVLQALVDRAAVVEESQQSVLELLQSAIDPPEDQLSAFVPALMTLKTYPIYNALLTGTEIPDDTDIPADAVDKEAEDKAAADARFSAWQNRRNVKARQGDLEPNIKGSLLLQGLLTLREINTVVLESLLAQDIDSLLNYAKNPISSRLLDAAFTQPNVPLKYRRKLMMAFMGRYKELVEDKLGSRVADTIWANADGYMKEKIARSLAPHATVIANHQYGKYFASKLKLHLLQRRPDEWKREVIGVRHHFAHQQDPPASAPTPPKLNGVSKEDTSRPKSGLNGDNVPSDSRKVQPIDTSASQGATVNQEKVVREEKDEIDELFAPVKSDRKKKKKRKA